MNDELIKYFITQGAFAALFVWLLFDTRKDSKEREVKYQDTIRENQNIISTLTKNLNVVDDVKSDVEEIKEYLFKK